MDLKRMSSRIVTIDSIPYYVEDMEEGAKLKKAKAYVVNVLGMELVLPYRGVYERDTKLEVGIYKKERRGQDPIVFYQLPKAKHRAKYSVDNIQEPGMEIFKSGNFVKNDLIIAADDAEGFKPPINGEDDMMMKIVKAAITVKDTPFSTYDRRFQKIDIGTNASNRKSNAKKALLNNNALSATKALQFSEVMDFELAIMVKNKPGTICPMKLEDDRPLVIFSGEKFDTSNPISIADIKHKLNFSDNSEA